MDNKEFSLVVLKELEEFRIKLENGEIQEGCSEWVVRMCQAIVAGHHFEDRKEWTKIIK